MAVGCRDEPRASEIPYATGGGGALTVSVISIDISGQADLRIPSGAMRKRGLAGGRGHRMAPTVSVRFPRILVLALEERGVDVSAFLARLGIERSLLDNPDARLPTDADDLLWAAAPALARDDDIGLHLGERLPTTAFDLISYTMRSSPTLGGAFERLARYTKLLRDQATIAVETRGDDARIRFALGPQ